MQLQEKRKLKMFIVCLLLWIVFNGKITLEILIFGLVISAAIYAMSCALLGFSVKKDAAFIRRLPGIAKLLVTLLIEIVKANIAVLAFVYGRKKPESEYVSFSPELKSIGAGAALADCITLTPGTITGELKNGEYTVHCLDGSLAEGIEDSCFVRQLKALETEEGRQ